MNKYVSNQINSFRIVSYYFYSKEKYSKNVYFSLSSFQPFENSVFTAKEIFHLKKVKGHFPGGPLVKNLHFHCKGHDFDPWSGN